MSRRHSSSDESAPKPPRRILRASGLTMVVEYAEEPARCIAAVMAVLERPARLAAEAEATDEQARCEDAAPSEPDRP